MSKASRLLLALAILPRFAAAQNVTGSGSTGKVPVFTGTSTVGNSPISISGNNVGIGTTGPSEALQILGNEAAPAIGSSNAGLARFSENSGGNGIDIGYYYVPGTAYGWIQSAFTGASAAYYTLNLNPLGGNVGIGTTNPIGQLSNNSVNYGDGGNGLSAGSFNWYHPAADGGWNAVSSAGPNGLIVATDQTNGIPFQVSSGTYNASTAQRANHLLTILGTGNVGVGTISPQAKLEINGNLRFTADGSIQTTAWTGVLCGGDYAESVNVAGNRTQFEPGDVLVIDPSSSGKFLKAAEPYSTSVTGIYATKPGVVGRRQNGPKANNEVPMAMIGIVPAKVSAENGSIHSGDLLVTSSTPGYAMKGTDRMRLTGAVVGKALGNLETGEGVIEIVVTLQ